MIYNFAQCSLDTGCYRLNVAGKAVSVEPLVFDLLLYLLERRDRVVGREELLQNLWPGKVVTDAALGARVKDLRRAVGDSGRQQSIIKTFHGRGYQLIAEVTESADVTIKAPKAPADSLDRDPPTRPSIAVMPFTNLSNDPEQAYFSNGITEDIIVELSRFHDLFVIARHSSFAFRNEVVDSAGVGRQLGVQYLLEGSIRKLAGRVRIAVQLVEVESGSHLWAERYDRELEDIFKVQDEVVRSIAATLFGKVSLAQRDRARAKPPSSMDAYDWFVQGRELYSTTTHDDNCEACKMFACAISLDSEFAAAYALLAQAILRDWITFWDKPPDSSYGLVWDNAKRSIELDDADSVTQSALGYAYLFRGEHDQARFHLNRALELNPADTDALIFMSRCEMLSGDTAAAIERISDANRYNPFGKYNWSLGTAYYAMRRYDEARSRLLAIHSPSPIMKIWTAAAQAQAGEVEQARRATADFIADAERQFEATAAPLPRSWLDFVVLRWPFRGEADRDHLVSGLRRAGLPD